VWLFDLERQAWTRVTSEANSAFPLWSDNGRRLTYVSDKAGVDNIFARPLDGSGAEERLLTSERPGFPFAWAPDGRLMYVAVDPLTLQDILLLRPGGEPPTPWLETRFAEGAPVISPDGRFVAYASGESGRNEIYVRPFQGSGEKATVSTEGGNEPVWSPTGRELFYRSRGAMMAVDVSTRPVFSAGRPRKLFEDRYESSSSFWPNYAVAPDGQRFLMVKALSSADAFTQINVVVNWFEELKRLVPAQ
jgi:Tol biopolymer transport system component